MDLERRLRESLAAREPPEDLTGAVLTSLQDRGRKVAPPRRTLRWQLPAALAATVLIVASGLHWQGMRQQRANRNYEQLVLALHITSHELSRFQQKLVPAEMPPEGEDGT